MKKIKIFNGTPHAINIIAEVSASYDKSIRKYVSDNPEVIRSIEPSGMLSAKMEDKITGDIDGIPEKTKIVTGHDPLPEGYDFYIVSALYFVAVQKSGGDISKLRCVIDPVFDIEGKAVIGCLALGQI